MHFYSKNVVKEDKLITLEDLWKKMKAKEPCGVCDEARKSARPLPSPYENARTEGEKYFLPTPFCVSHRKREDILYEDDLISVKKYWKRVKKNEICIPCEAAKKWCSPLPVVNNRAFTEGERWFYPSPLCLRHKDRRKILDDNGEMVKVEEYWKVRLEAEKKEVEKEAEKIEKRRDSSQRRTDSVSSSEERGRPRRDEREQRRPSRASDLLSPDYTASHRQQSRGRPRSTVDPLRNTTDPGPHDRRRPRSFDASRAYESGRKSRSPSPYPAEWTDEQRKEYFECFRTLVQPSHEELGASGRTAQFSPPPPPPNAASQAATSPIPPTSSHNTGHTWPAAVPADILSPRSAMSGSPRRDQRDCNSGSDGSDHSLPDQSSQKQDTRSLVEKLGIQPPLPICD
jgi:hypothetical protein